MILVHRKATVEDILGIRKPEVVVVDGPEAADAVIAAVLAEAEARNIVSAAASVHDPSFSAHDRARRQAEGAYAAAMAKWLDEAEAAAAKRRKRTDEELLALFLLLFGAAASKAISRVTRAMGGVPAPGAGEELWKARQAGLQDFPVRVLGRLREAGGIGAGSAPENAPGSEVGGKAGGLKAKRQAARARREAVAAEREAVEAGEGRRAVETEAQAAYGSAQVRLLQQAGYTSAMWQTMEDERVRESHRLCQEQGEVPLGEPYHNGLRFPGDPNGPPEETCNCRCWLVGVRRAV